MPSVRRSLLVAFGACLFLLDATMVAQTKVAPNHGRADHGHADRGRADQGHVNKVTHAMLQAPMCFIASDYRPLHE